MTAKRDPVWDEWAGTLAALRDSEGELHDPDGPPGVARRDKLRAAHRTWRHLKVSAGIDDQTRDRYAAAFHSVPERTSP